MEQDSTEQRVSKLEGAVERHEERINAHGRKLDEHGAELVRLRVLDEQRDDQLQRMEEKLDRQDGKLDGILMRPGREYEDIKGKLVWLVVAAVASFLLGRFIPA